MARSNEILERLGRIEASLDHLCNEFDRLRDKFDAHSHPEYSEIGHRHNGKGEKIWAIVISSLTSLMVALIARIRF